MSELTFSVKGGKGCVSSNGQEKELSKEFMLELFQNVLGVVSPDRDYTSVTSLRKLLRVIDLEFEPDESEDEASEASEAEEEEEKPAPVVKKTVKRAVVKRPPPAKKEESEEEESEDSEE